MTEHRVEDSAHHRSEVAPMFALLGHDPDGTDLTEYYLGHAEQEWKPAALA